MYTRSHDTIHALLLEAKQEYEAETYYRVSVYVCDQFNNWYYAGEIIAVEVVLFTSSSLIRFTPEEIHGFRRHSGRSKGASH